MYVGDSGSGLLCPIGDQWILAGILSVVAKTTLDKVPQRPSMLVRASAYTDWMKQKMSEDVTCSNNNTRCKGLSGQSSCKSSFMQCKKRE
ncbi:hypothetical protein Ciccas_012844 [Cichlidogyrus casuarinus]|uniref:Peptidase S1 domain-containing protein n=1 Tax=Cichlidogyrus casuarinus TaxID=1844966 RepID=A0ABD2PQ91_9PLAT